MKKIKVQDAVGMELCHDITEMNDGFKGVPSQPGNMTLVAYLGDIPILGVPGAAIKLPTTVFDVLLPQVFAGDKLTKEELIGLADGGLCQMCKVCHWPNCTFGRY